MNINDVTANRRSALHLAAEHNRAVMCAILLDNHIHANLLDVNQNTGREIYGFPSLFISTCFVSLALHMAVQHGHLEVVRSLLAESDIDVLTLNAK